MNRCMNFAEFCLLKLAPLLKFGLRLSLIYTFCKTTVTITAVALQFQKSIAWQPELRDDELRSKFSPNKLRLPLVNRQERHRNEMQVEQDYNQESFKGDNLKKKSPEYVTVGLPLTAYNITSSTFRNFFNQKNLDDVNKDTNFNISEVSAIWQPLPVHPGAESITELRSSSGSCSITNKLRGLKFHRLSLSPKSIQEIAHSGTIWHQRRAVDVIQGRLNSRTNSCTENAACSDDTNETPTGIVEWGDLNRIIDLEHTPVCRRPIRTLRRNADAASCSSTALPHLAASNCATTLIDHPLEVVGTAVSECAQASRRMVRRCLGRRNAKSGGEKYGASDVELVAKTPRLKNRFCLPDDSTDGDRDILSNSDIVTTEISRVTKIPGGPSPALPRVMMSVDQLSSVAPPPVACAISTVGPVLADLELTRSLLEGARGYQRRF